MSRIVRGHFAFEDHFSQIPNAWLRDESLSYKARGLLAYLMSHREGWSVSVASLTKASKDGRDSVRTGLMELEQAGYLQRGRERDDGGRLGEPVYILQEPKSENPTLEPKSENLPLENPTVGKPDGIRTPSFSEDQEKEHSPLPGLESVPAGTKLKQPDGFEEFWDRWPKKVARIEAVKVWTKMKPAAREQALRGASRIKNMVDGKLQDKQYLPNPDRWLRNERWNDMEVQGAPPRRVEVQAPNPMVGDKRYHSGPNILDQLTDDELDQIVATARAEGRQFTEADARRIIESRKS